MKRAGKEWEVYSKEGETSCYVKGLLSEPFGDEEPRDRMLLFFTGFGDVDDPRNVEDMRSALYDIFQTEDELQDGDSFKTAFGTFHCRSFHVLSTDEAARWDAAPEEER